jgi:large subunit ribosomal protein L17
MRHKVKSVRLNRPKAQLRALVRSLATSLVLYESIETTRDKAKLVRGYVDRIITHAKKSDTVNAIRYVNEFLLDKNASKKVMEELVPRFEKRTSGFTRYVNTRIRKGDNAQLVLFQLLNN